MAWNNQGGSGGPWGGGGDKSPWNRGSGGGGNRPPDFEEMLKRGQDRMKSMLPGGFGSGRAIVFIGVAALALWMATGFYVVDPSQVGVNLIFGKYSSQTGSGLHWNWPAPIGDVETPDVQNRFTTEVGYRSEGGTRTEISEESLMLTKDENIIDIKVRAFWRITDVQKYLFQIDDPKTTVKNAIAQ